MPTNNADAQREHYDGKLKDVTAEDYKKFYKFLDKELSYSCNRWFDDQGSPIANTNEEATINKWNEYAQRLGWQVDKDKRMLEIGFGFGTFSKWVKKNYDFKIDAVNVSEKNFELATEDSQGVNYLHQSWEDMHSKREYDYIVSEGVLVHQRDKKAFFEFIRRALKPGGKALVREMHFTPGNKLDKAVCRGLNATYSYSGSYCPTKDNEDIIKDLGIWKETVLWNIDNYIKTQEGWLEAMRVDRKAMKKISFEGWQDRMLNFSMFLLCFKRGAFEMTTFLMEK